MNWRDPEARGAGHDFMADLPEQLFYMVYQVHRRREIAIEQVLKDANLTMALWRALLTVHRMEPCTMNELARWTSLERTSLTRTLDQMEDQGLITRTTPPKDRRQVVVALTPAGHEAYQRGYSAVTAWNRAALDGLPTDQLAALKTALDHILTSAMDDKTLARDIVEFDFRPRPHQA
ncbi:MarR family transcriptional regulator [Caulobacter sp. NIBR1757]|uniref:MarR family winged helix-turn-helix transcriptional regulator n=1 Tax=Caulobacter sp. NIBR1757 TaxID=3016000 RepID=UPI0022F0B8EF|nr:MarR family transcriptional regulator [Caulobacter sp. NIBR1757]WGM40685.1 Transcriptional regulator SlyA [Caulobacter sp. NIBR1757]